MSKHRRTAHVSDLYKTSAVAQEAVAAILGPDPSEPAWVGWVVCQDVDGDGFRRCRVRLPQSVLEQYAVAEPSGPDLRGNLAVQIQTDMMRDDFLQEVVRAAKEEW
jgi:hypothetical protein